MHLSALKEEARKPVRTQEGRTYKLHTDSYLPWGDRANRATPTRCLKWVIMLLYNSWLSKQIISHKIRSHKSFILSLSGNNVFRAFKELNFYFFLNPPSSYHLVRFPYKRVMRRFFKKNNDKCLVWFSQTQNGTLKFKNSNESFTFCKTQKL